MDQKDRRIFLQTPDEACKMTGWRIHAWTLMGNHYHLMLATPEANLVEGMKWLQNTYTRKFNARHGRRGGADIMERCRFMRYRWELGSVMPQRPLAWIWKRKVQGKTVTRGLLGAQAERMKRAIANHRALEGMIREMREITQKLILQAPEATDFPPPRKRPKATLT